MFRTIFKLAGTMTACSVFGGMALAAFPADMDLIEAEVVNVDFDGNTLTVRFEENDVVETYAVAEDAEFYTWDGVLQRPQEFTDIHAGQMIGLEFGGVEGEQTLQKVINDDSES